MGGSMATKRLGLGKGLGALIPEMEPEASGGLLICGIEEIVPNRSQPRKHFDESKIQELADSIREKGILEPLMVRRVEQGYELILGERRWRAAQKAGLHEVPVIVKDLPDREVLEISLIENLQREDLNPIEEAEAFKRLTEEFDLSQEELSKRIGKDRATIANTLRLLKLPSEIRTQLFENVITAGHARAILSLDTSEKQKELSALIIQKGLSVREAEAQAKRMAEKRQKGGSSRTKDPDVESQVTSLQDALKRHLATQVRILHRGKRGKIEIDYYSHEDLGRIVEAIVGESQSA
jgi:ParB family chromosome partitioning protein